MHSSSKTQTAHLKMDEVFTKILSKYADFADIFSPKLVAKLFKHTEINNYIIVFIDNWQSSYSFIYSFGPIEFKILKA